MSFPAAPRTSSHPVCSPHQEVSPFPARPGPVLWRLLTPPCPSNAIADAVVRINRTGPEASQGKPRLFPAVPAGFTPAASGQLSGVTAMGRLTPRSLALYPIPVRRGRVSPPASFRFRLATDTLALGYTVRCHLRPLETLTPDMGMPGTHEGPDRARFAIWALSGSSMPRPRRFRAPRHRMEQSPVCWLAPDSQPGTSARRGWIRRGCWRLPAGFETMRFAAAAGSRREGG